MPRTPRTTGYACFVQGNGGCLVPASGECYKPILAANYSWSNFVCARRGEPSDVLWELAGQLVPGGPAACDPRVKIANGADDKRLQQRLRVAAQHQHQHQRSAYTNT